eukprot:365475-Chlamydomonas_euryale.AAC.15
MQARKGGSMTGCSVWTCPPHASSSNDTFAHETLVTRDLPPAPSTERRSQRHSRQAHRPRAADATDSSPAPI